MTLSPEKKRYWNIMLKAFKANAFLSPPQNQPHCAPERAKIFSRNLCKFLSSKHMFCTRKARKWRTANSDKVNKVENLFAVKIVNNVQRPPLCTLHMPPSNPHSGLLLYRNFFKLHLWSCLGRIGFKVDPIYRTRSCLALQKEFNWNFISSLNDLSLNTFLQFLR